MGREAAAALPAPEHWFRLWMPWAFARLGAAGGAHLYLPLNRLRAPLGRTERDRGTRWRDHAAAAIVFRTDPREFEGVWHEPPGAPPDRRRRLILYDDAPESRMDYFARFERLMARASRLHGAAPAACWGGESGGERDDHEVGHDDLLAHQPWRDRPG